MSTHPDELAHMREVREQMAAEQQPKNAQPDPTTLRLRSEAALFRTQCPLLWRVLQENTMPGCRPRIAQMHVPLDGPQSLIVEVAQHRVAQWLKAMADAHEEPKHGSAAGQA